ncbi:MAG: DNA methyltransferase [Candidatus Parvarchaeum sp.]
MSYKSVWDFGREGKANYSVHKIGEYPSKIRPIVFSHIIERFSNKGDIILDPFAGSGTVAVEAKLRGRSSISYDVNPNAIELTQKKLDKLDKEEMKRAYKELLSDLRDDFQTVLGNGEIKHNSKLKLVQARKEVKKIESVLKQLDDPDSIYYKTTHFAEVRDSRQLSLPNESVDAVITDIPYANMIKYSDLKTDLSTIEDYDKFLEEISKSFSEIWRVLKKDKYCVILVADYRVAASRKILPVHSDVINIMRDLGFTLFDLYIWRYYRSGGFRPFGKKPFQAMNVHSYILVFYKPDKAELNKANRPQRYRKRLTAKLVANNPKAHVQTL